MLLLIIKLTTTAQMVKNCHVLVDYLLVKSIICLLIVVSYSDCLMFVTLISVVVIYANYPLVRLY